MRLLIASVLVVSVVALVGCRGRSAPPKDPPLKVLRVVRSIDSPSDREHFNAWRDAFESACPGWTLQNVNLAQSRARAFYTATAAEGTLPEVVQLFDLTRWLVDTDCLQPLDDAFYTRFGLPLPEPYVLKRWATWDDEQFMGLVVNMALWRAAGVTTVPQTWDELLGALQKIREHLDRTGLTAKGYRPLAYGTRDFSARFPLELALCADLYDRDGSAPSWTRRRCSGKVSFLESRPAAMVVTTVGHLLRDFGDADHAAGHGHDDQKRLFLSGKAGAWFTGTWVGREIDASGATVEAAMYPIPSVLGRKPAFVSTRASAGGWGLSIAAKGVRRDRAIKALELLYDAEVYQRYLTATGGLGRSGKLLLTGPVCRHASARAFYRAVGGLREQFGVIAGFCASVDDQPPPAFVAAMAPIVAKMLTSPGPGAKTDVTGTLRALDTAWDAAMAGPPE